jgi:X-domain of DnaJ-containing
MEKAQARGDVDEEELRALEMDVTGKILLASWRGARLEVVQVVREVCDNVLKEPGISDAVLVNRAKGLLLLGAVFKSTVPDESDEERRELERCDSIQSCWDVAYTLVLLGWLLKLQSLRSPPSPINTRSPFPRRSLPRSPLLLRQRRKPSWISLSLIGLVDRAC